MRSIVLLPAAVVLAAAAITGCSSSIAATTAAHEEITVALLPRSGSPVNGIMTLTEDAGVLHLRGTVRRLQPGSEHGFHIHEKGDCSAPDASSAGGHFNPDGKAHGKVSAAVHHAGDLPSLKASPLGVATIDVVLHGVTLGEGPTSIKGRSLVVHGGADDFTSQPSGNSGPRVACGVI